MKVITLLFIATLSIFICQCNTNTPPDPKPPSGSEKGIFFHLSNTISSHARLTIGLHILAELIQPTSDHAALAGFFNINDSVAIDLIHIDGKQIERVVKDLEDLKEHMFDSGNYLARIKDLEDTYQKIVYAELTSSEKEKNEMYETMGQWKETVKRIDEKLLVNLKKYIDDLEDMSAHTPTENVQEKTDPNTHITTKTKLGTIKDTLATDEHIRGATTALINFPADLEKVMNQFPTLPKNENFTPVFEPIKKMISIFGKINSVPFDQQEISKLERLVSKSSSFEKASEVSKSLLVLSNVASSTEGIKWIGVFPNDFLDLNKLRRDLNGTYLKKSLNEGKKLDVLKKVLTPLFEAEAPMHNFWSAVSRIMNTQSMKDECLKMSKLLNLIVGSRFSVSKLNSTWNSLDTDNLSLLPEKLRNFNTTYYDITDGISRYRSAMQSLTTLKANDNFKESSKISEYAASVSAITGGNSLETYKEQQGKVKEMKGKLEVVRDALAEIVKLFKAVALKFESISSFKTVVDESEKQINETIGSFTTKMNETKEYMAHVKSGLEFVKEYGATFKQNAVFGEFTKQVGELENVVKNGMTNLNIEKEKLKSLAKSSLYEQVTILNERFELKEKLMAGSILFKLFSEVLAKKDSYHKFFETVDKIDADIQKTLARNINRKQYSQKINDLKSIKTRFEAFEKEILKKKGFYEPEPLEELIQVRWLIENLEDITNPGFRKEEWSEFPKQLDGEFKKVASKNGLEESLNKLVDLDFAAHQKEVRDAYKNLRGLKRFHMAIEGIEKVSKNTWWMYNHQYVKFGILAIATLVGNGFLYGCTWIYFKRQEAREKEKEEEEEFKYYQRKARKLQNKEEDSEDEKYNKQYMLYKRMYNR